MNCGLENIHNDYTTPFFLFAMWDSEIALLNLDVGIFCKEAGNKASPSAIQLRSACHNSHNRGKKNTQTRVAHKHTHMHIIYIYIFFFVHILHATFRFGRNVETCIWKRMNSRKWLLFEAAFSEGLSVRFQFSNRFLSNFDPSKILCCLHSGSGDVWWGEEEAIEA